MSEKPGSMARLRIGIWVLGTLLCLGYYVANAVQLSRSTDKGLEQPLFPVPGLRVIVYENPAGGRSVFKATKDLEPSLQPPPPPPVWPRTSLSPRLLTFWEPAGTWEATPSGLHRVWRYSPQGWDGEHQLWGTLGGDWAGPNMQLDLRTQRTRVMQEDSRTPWEYPGYEEVSEPLLEEPDLTGSLGSPLEALPHDLKPDQQRRYRIGSRRVHLLWSDGSPHAALYAASDTAAPRLLRLTHGQPVELSRDGKTLFFTRDQTLWRLDLRKPLPELLDEVPLPILPEPPLE